MRSPPSGGSLPRCAGGTRPPLCTAALTSTRSSGASRGDAAAARRRRRRRARDRGRPGRSRAGARRRAGFIPSTPGSTSQARQGLCSCAVNDDRDRHPGGGSRSAARGRGSARSHGDRRGARRRGGGPVPDTRDQGPRRGQAGRPALRLTPDAFALAASVPPLARTLAAAYWPGPLTLVLDRPGGGTVGVRVPADSAVRAVLAAYGEPLYATSANPLASPPRGAGRGGCASIRSGGPGCRGRAGDRRSSAVVDLSGGRTRLLRASGELTEEALERLARV